MLAHELAHVRRRDVLTQTYAVLLSTTLLELTRLGGFLSRFLLAVLAPVASAFTHLLLSSKRELAADRVSAALTDPHDLADALLRLDRAAELVKFTASPATEPLYTVSPFDHEERVARMFVTHPPVRRPRRSAATGGGVASGDAPTLAPDSGPGRSPGTRRLRRRLVGVLRQARRAAVHGARAGRLLRVRPPGTGDGHDPGRRRRARRLVLREPPRRGLCDGDAARVRWQQGRGARRDAPLLAARLRPSALRRSWARRERSRDPELRRQRAGRSPPRRRVAQRADGTAAIQAGAHRLVVRRRYGDPGRVRGRRGRRVRDRRLLVLQPRRHRTSRRRRTSTAAGRGSSCPARSSSPRRAAASTT